MEKKKVYRKKIALFLAIITAVSLLLCACAQETYAQLRHRINNLVGDYEIQQMTGVEEPYVPDTVSEEKYVYGTLSQEEKNIYDQMLYAIENFESEYALSTTDKQLADRIYGYVMADYGDLFWQSGYSYNAYTVDGEVRRLDFTPKYTMTKEEKEAYEAGIEEQIPEFLEGVTEADSDYDKAKTVFENLVSKVDYNVDSENNQNIISVFLNRVTVCQGYACAVNVLLDRLGIQSCIVTGYVGEERHAWNLVRLDGEYYYLDVTWGNSSYANADSSTGKHTDYAYLNFDTADMNLTYTVESQFALPECTATADNYYHHEGLYFEKMDTRQIGEAIEQGYSGMTKTASIRLASGELYDDVISYFVTQKHIGDYCWGLRSYSYLTDSDKHIITFIFS